MSIQESIVSAIESAAQTIGETPKCENAYVLAKTIKTLTETFVAVEELRIAEKYGDLEAARHIQKPQINSEVRPHPSIARKN